MSGVRFVIVSSLMNLLSVCIWKSGDGGDGGDDGDSGDPGTFAQARKTLVK